MWSKVFKTVLLMGLSFVSLTAIGGSDDNDTQKNIEWLFMVTSDQASIKNNNGNMQLIIPVDSSNTAGFGDRPVRIVKKMSIEDLATMWGQGANSFRQDPPNAGMYLAKKHGIVVLKGLEIKNDNAIFTLTMDDNTQDTFTSDDHGILALVIDLDKTKVEKLKLSI